MANLHYLPDALERHLKALDVQTIHEPVLLETGGGVRNALPLLGDGPVITLNSDAVWRGVNPIAAMLAAWRPDDMDALLTLIHPETAFGYVGQGDFSLSETRRLTRGPGFIYTGLQIMKTDRLNTIGEDVFSLNRIWDLMADDGRLFGVVYKGGWCDVGQPESIPLAEAMLNV